MSDVVDPPVRDAESAPTEVADEAPGQVPARTGRRRWRWLRVTVWCLLTGVVVLALVAGLTVTWIVRHSYPTVDGRLTVRGLHDRVEVVRDKLGVPQIYAANPHDLFLAQGYVHAQDRFWEMDVRRHITAGRLAEMFGPDQVDTDATVRTMGWYRTAQQELALLTPSTRDHLQAYADGVNAYLKEHSGAALSVEYPILGVINSGYRPQPWTSADSVAWLKAMAWDLNGTFADQVQHALLSATLSPEQVAALYPPYDFGRWQPTVQGTGSVQVTRAASASGAGRPTATIARPDPHTGLTHLEALLGPPGKGIGSNSWVVAGSRTTTGKPILANDPHLAPGMPSVWYQMGLHCTATGPACPFDVSGFTFSGMPGVIVGHNDRVTWGVTNLAPADTDLVLEKVTGDTYEYRGRQLPVETRQEVIKVAGGPPRTITVRSTVHGPILSDVIDKVKQVGTVGREPGVEPLPGGYAVALRWTAIEPHNTMDAVFEMDTATDWPSFRTAASRFAAPVQNLTYADRDGHIGYQTPGLIPVRPRGDGRYPVPGWTGEYDWAGYIPFASLPSVLDPPSGYVVSANNAVVGPSYPYLITNNWGDGYRSQRIVDLIEHGGKLSVDAMTRIQTDTYNANAATLTPYLLAVTPGPAATRARDLLRGWDFSQPADSAAAAYFNAVWRHLLALTFDDDLARNPEQLDVDGGGQWFDVVRNLLTRPDDPWWRDARDPRGLSNRDDVLRAAMDDAAKELTGRLGTDPRTWRWGALHQLTLRNETLGSGGPAPVQWLLNRGPFPVGGGTSTVDANGWNAPDGYDVNWVPSMRMVVDMSDLDASRWINLTGASGHAFDDHYDDQQTMWQKGQTAAWPFHRAAVDHAADHRLTLVGK